MTEANHPILIGDDNGTRVKWLAQFLDDYYNITSQWADTLDKVCALARRVRRSVIFLTDTLPLSDDNDMRKPQSHFDQLRGVDPAANRVYVATRADSPYVAGQISIFLPSSAPTEAERDQIINALKPLQHVLPLATATIDEIDKLTRWHRQDQTLREQIRSLSLVQDLEDGKRHLFHIIRNCFDCRAVGKIQLASLTQGKSGARVFHLTVTEKRGEPGAEGLDGRPREYVLKLCKERDIWKLQSEVNGYLKARTSKLYNPYKGHIPVLQTPRLSKASTDFPPVPDEYKYIASSSLWPAIHYDFLGGSLGECMTLETALVAAPERLRAKVKSGAHDNFALADNKPATVMKFRTDFLKALLDALCNILYLSAKNTDRKSRQLWKGGDAPDKRYVTLPPYQLTARSRWWIQEFLDSEEAKIGARLFPGVWEECRDNVLSLVHTAGTKTFGALGEKLPVILSPVHGDLNAGNVFLWLEQPEFPFLIDLPFYQNAGHSLQDFARLEAEVKFALMDRQEESPPKQLAAYDHSAGQVPLWRELEDSLLNYRPADPAEPAWRAPGFRDNVCLTYRLVRLIRDKAAQVQQQPCARSSLRPAPFMDEYLPALLYPTVRAITYPTLSLFKRLLAVYSAGSILQRYAKRGR